MKADIILLQDVTSIGLVVLRHLEDVFGVEVGRWRALMTRRWRWPKMPVVHKSDEAVQNILNNIQSDGDVVKFDDWNVALADASPGSQFISLNCGFLLLHPNLLLARFVPGRGAQPSSNFDSYASRVPACVFFFGVDLLEATADVSHFVVGVYSSKQKLLDNRLVVFPCVAAQ
jgi:hypothetical protein